MGKSQEKSMTDVYIILGFSYVVKQCFGSDPAWIRIIGGLLDPDPGGEKLRNKTKKWKENN